jgi:hypothetical protein
MFNYLHHQDALMMEAISTSETSASLYQTVLLDILEHSHVCNF